MKNYSKILTEKQQKYQHYFQVNLINMNILQEKKILPSYQIIEQQNSRIIEQATFMYSPEGKAFEKQIKKIEKKKKK